MSEDRREQSAGGWRKELYLWLGTAVAILTVLTLLFVFVGRIIVVDNISMLPTLERGDLLLLQSVGYTPRQGDIVALTKEFEYADGPIVKRVIATGGQHVEIDYAAGTVTVDGLILDEHYLDGWMVTPHYENLASVDVPQGCIFVIGDNRNQSSDSRNVTLGTVDERYVLGRVVWVLFPFRNFGPAG